MIKENRFWSLFGKFSALVLTLAALVAIYYQIFPSEPDLVVRGTAFNSYALPVNLIDKLKEVDNNTSYNSLQKYINEYDSIYGSKLEDEYQLLSYLSKKIIPDWGEFGYNFNHYKSFLIFNITNEGSKPSQDIVFSLPTDGIALITEENENQTVTAFDKEIKLPDLRPEKNISITIWAESKLYYFDEDKIKISDKYGIGSVSMTIEVSGFAKFVSEYLPIIIFLIVMSFLILFGILFSLSSEKSESPKSSPEFANVEDKGKDGTGNIINSNETT